MYNNRIFTLFGAVLLFLSSAFCDVHADSDADKAAREAWVLGYMKLQEATEAEGKNQLVEALQLYREARDSFEEVKAEFPEWQSDLVNFRLKFCNSKLNRLNARVSSHEDERSKDDLIVSNRQLKIQLDESKQRVAILERQLEQLKQENTNADALSQQIEELSKVNQQNRMLKAENTMLREDNALLREGQLEQIREIKVLLDAFETRLTRLGKAKEALIKEVERLIQERNQAVRRAEKLQNALKQLDAVGQ